MGWANGGHTSRWSGTEREQRARQAAEEVGLRARSGADIEAGDDEADVEAEHRRLNTGDGAPFAIPGLCLVARLGIAAQNRQVLDGAPRADVVSDLVDFSGERLGTGQAH